MLVINLIKQDILNLLKTPIVLTVCTVYPWALVGIFGWVFSDIYGGEGVSSYDYYGVTMILFLIISCVTITPNTFMDKRLRQGNIRISYAPVSKVQIYISKLISSYVFMGISFSINIILMNCLHIVNFGGENFFYILFLFLVFLLFTVCIGGAVCVIVKTEELTNTILSSITNVMALLSGMFFQVDGLGEWVSKISNLSPLKWILNLSFSVIYDENFENYIYVILGLILLSLLSIIVMHLKYKPEDYI